MDGGASSVVIELLIQNLINTLKEEYSLIRGLEEDAQQLQTTLDLIQSYLSDAEKKSIDQNAVKIWFRELEAVAFDADNILDELSYHLLRNKVKKMKSPTAKNKLLSCFSSCSHIGRRRDMALTIKQINASFESKNKRAIALSLQSVVANAPAALPVSSPTNSYTFDPIFIGRVDDVPNLVVKLTRQIPAEEILSILAIVGMGGMGKTTLTRKIFNHEDIKARFGSHIWVHVSQIFDPNMLFKKILSTFTSQTTADGYETEESILRRVEEALKDKTYLLVLDDVWNEDLPKWENFINSISGVTSTKGNAIIMTTRKQKVASIVRPLHIHSLNGLSSEECWLIIKAKAFDKGDDSSYFEAIGLNIARKCHGLPLAANVVGGTLYKASEQKWISIEQHWLSKDEEQSNSKILRLSFDNLSLPSLKKCFAYCSIFPKGHQIRKGTLIEFWMAEGFLQPDERNDLESMGQIFFNVLLQNSLLLVAGRDDYRNDAMCVMHDLVHDLASDLLGDSKDRYSTHGGYDSSRNSKETAKHLRVLIFQGKTTDTLFLDFRCLHVLILESYIIEELPSSISKLIHLRNLDISRTRIQNMPEWIGGLHYLQILNAIYQESLKLPSTLKYLISLRHLYIQNRIELPPEIGKLTNLQTLEAFRVRDLKGYRIEELGSLNNLKGKLCISDLKNVHSKEEAEKANLSQKTNLLQLELRWGERGEEERNDDENVLEGLQAPPNLEELEINGFIGKRFPSWTLKMAVRDEPGGSWVGLDKLKEITLSSCQGCEEIPTLGHLPNLKSLRLEGLSNVTLIDSSFYGIASSVGGVIFPALESILLSDMYELREWAQVEFPNATQVKVFPRLQSLKIDECDKLECLPSWLFYKAHNLEELEISECSELRELPDGLHTLNSLKSMTINTCPNLKSIANPSGGGSLTSLRRLKIRYCQELMEIQMVESWALPSLKYVTMVGLMSLKNLPSFIDCLVKSPLLQELKIVSVPKFMSASSVEIWPFRNLQKLEIDVSIEWSRENSVAIKETVDGILKECSLSLVDLILTGLEIWESLPPSIQYLTALTKLRLKNIGVEELPEWLGKLSSLRRLYVSNCTKLRRLSSVDAIQRLTQLTNLEIRDCPELRIARQQGGDDSEWLKISHVRHVYYEMNGQRHKLSSVGVWTEQRRRV